MDDDNEFPLPDGLTVDDLIRVCDEASSHKQQCTLPNNESTTKVEKDVSINIVSPMKKKKRIKLQKKSILNERCPKNVPFSNISL